MDRPLSKCCGQWTCPPDTLLLLPRAGRGRGGGAAGCGLRDAATHHRGVRGVPPRRAPRHAALLSHRRVCHRQLHVPDLPRPVCRALRGQHRPERARRAGRSPRAQHCGAPHLGGLPLRPARTVRAPQDHLCAHAGHRGAGEPAGAGERGGWGSGGGGGGADATASLPASLPPPPTSHPLPPPTHTHRAQLTSGQVRVEQVDAFLRMGGALDPAGVRRKPRDWIPDAVWLGVVALSALDAFRDLPDSVARSDAAWRAWCDAPPPPRPPPPHTPPRHPLPTPHPLLPPCPRYDLEAPEAAPVPDLETRLSKFERMMVVRQVRAHGGWGEPAAACMKRTGGQGRLGGACGPDSRLVCLSRARRVFREDRTLPRPPYCLYLQGVPRGPHAAGRRRLYRRHAGPALCRVGAAVAGARLGRVATKVPPHLPAVAGWVGGRAGGWVGGVALRVGAPLPFLPARLPSAARPLRTPPPTHTHMLAREGADPTKLIEDLAKRRKIRTLGVSMGQGQEVVARKYVAAAAAEGHWVLLQNTHLGLGYLAEVCVGACVCVRVCRQGACAVCAGDGQARPDVLCQARPLPPPPPPVPRARAGGAVARQGGGPARAVPAVDHGRAAPGLSHRAASDVDQDHQRGPRGERKAPAALVRACPANPACQPPVCTAARRLCHSSPAAPTQSSPALPSHPPPPARALQGVKAGLRASYQAITQDTLDAVNRPEWRQLLFATCFLHSVVQVRVWGWQR